ncbi:hypothetical protein CJ030_MR5G016625 [Morella rubra]|uniref:Uncharacterized protein n=1 Tax=Morella rubra TaxID=262757 RepID=A0A6A1VQE1_9ROSI|nr:hypothetical protein CJ030_MR5G016625 [Morella rubra]
MGNAPFDLLVIKTSSALGRFASFLFLSGVEDGGKTMFPFENGMNMDGSYSFKGDGLLFDSMFPNLTIDPKASEGRLLYIKGQEGSAELLANLIQLNCG